MKNLTDATFHAERIKPGYMVADFWSVWCPPCNAMTPIIEEVAKTHPAVNFVKVNTAENVDLTTEYQIQTIPSFILFKDGEVVHRWSGLTNAQGFGKILESNGVIQ